DITKLLGVPAMVNIIHKTSKSNNEYAVVSGITPLPKGFECPPQLNENFEFNFTDKIDIYPSLPQWLREKIAQSEEYKSLNGQNSGESYREHSEVNKYENNQLPPTPPLSEDAALVNENDHDDLPF
ncbi:MAG: hypothetical protein AAFY00_10485, partial [Bacteroidota bacterium]